MCFNQFYYWAIFAFLRDRGNFSSPQAGLATLLLFFFKLSDMPGHAENGTGQFLRT